MNEFKAQIFFDPPSDNGGGEPPLPSLQDQIVKCMENLQQRLHQRKL